VSGPLWTDPPRPQDAPTEDERATFADPTLLEDDADDDLPFGYALGEDESADNDETLTDEAFDAWFDGELTNAEVEASQESEMEHEEYCVDAFDEGDGEDQRVGYDRGDA
jgi:hypothetical protein